MTKATISVGMQAMLDSGANTLAWAVKLTRLDGTVYGFTSHDVDADISGVTYRAGPGLDVKSFANAAGLAVANNELTFLEDDSAFTRLEVLCGRWDVAAYEIFQYDYADLSNGIIQWPYGTLGNITPSYGAFVAELRDRRQCLQPDTTAVFQEGCRNNFGDSKCGKTLADYTVSFSVSSVPSAWAFIDGSRTEAADWFGNGSVTFDSDPDLGGLNHGLTFKVRLYSNGEFTFETPTVYPVAVGNIGTAVAGCRKRMIEDCRDKFDNVLRFNGEYNKPTADGIAVPTAATTIAPASPDASPSPALPTPGAFNAAARIVALDYTQTYDSGNVADLSRYGLVIRGMTTNKAATIGATYVSDLKTANPNLLFAGYIKFNELKSPQTSTEDFYAAYLEAISNGWFVTDEPSGARVQSAPGNGCDEMNITAGAALNGSSQRWTDYLAEFVATNRFTHYTPDYAFFDDAWNEARVTADYANTGTNQTPSASAAAIVAGNTSAVSAIRSENTGIKVIANADNDLSDFDGVFDAAFNEGCVGRSYGTFSVSGISGVRERQLAHISHTIDGMAILMSYGESTDYKTHRFAKCMAMMFDSHHCAVDSTPSLTSVWLDESGQDIGVRTDDVPSAAQENGVWCCRFETGIVIVNPQSTSASIDVTGLGSYKHFTGTQDATLNDGSTVSGPLTIAAHSGLLLIDV